MVVVVVIIKFVVVIIIFIIIVVFFFNRTTLELALEAIDEWWFCCSVKSKKAVLCRVSRVLLHLVPYSEYPGRTLLVGRWDCKGKDWPTAIICWDWESWRRIHFITMAAASLEDCIKSSSSSYMNQGWTKLQEGHSSPTYGPLTSSQ